MKHALTMRFPNKSGTLVRYKRSDLIYDCKHTLVSVPSDDTDDSSDEEKNEIADQLDIDHVHDPILGINRVITTEQPVPSAETTVSYSQYECDTALGWGDEDEEDMLPVPTIRVNSATYGVTSSWGSAGLNNKLCWYC